MASRRDRLLALGFRDWDTRGLLLIPRERYDSVPDGTRLTCITGGVVIKGKQAIDLDTRYGLIAYGVYPDKECEPVIRALEAAKKEADHAR